MTSFEELANKAEKLRDKLKRTEIHVRDAMEILGYRSTSAAAYALNQMVEAGLIEYEPPKKDHVKGRFYL